MNEDYISKIGIIGLGNIGQRHLESLMQSSSKLDIYLYDLDINKVLDSIKKNNFKNQIIRLFHIKDLNLLPDELTFCIVATPSLHRLSTVLKIKSKIRYLLLEKVLTTTHEELNLFSKYSKNFDAVYVNIPYYYEDIFNKILSLMPEVKKIIFKGGFFGIACNLVHLLDISEKIFQGQILEFNQNETSLKWRKASRKGYYDLTGELNLKLPGGREIKIISKENSNTNINIICEDKSSTLFYDWESGYLKQNNSIILKNLITYQSSRTLEILDYLLNDKKPKVSDLNKAIRLHKHLINILQPSWDKFLKNNIQLPKDHNKMLIT